MRKVSNSAHMPPGDTPGNYPRPDRSDQDYKGAVHMMEFYNRVPKLRGAHTALGREPNNEEIAKKLVVPVRKVEEVFRRFRTYKHFKPYW